MQGTHDCIPEQQECTRCHQLFPLDKQYFRPNSAYRRGFMTQCRRCESERASEWNRQNPERARQNNRNSLNKRREQNQLYQRKRYQEMLAALKLVQKLGLDPDTSEKSGQ